MSTARDPHRQVVPPDGGWGWVVVLTSLLSTAVIYVLRASFAMLYLEWTENLHSDHGSVGWVGSLFLSTGSLVGVMSGALIDVHGCRMVALVGAVLLVAGLLISTFVNSVLGLCLTFGVIAGVGLGMCSLGSIVIVQQYFTKKRALAAGLALCGIALGNITGGPLSQYLFHQYGWRGGLLLLAGLALHLVALALTFRPLRNIKAPQDTANIEMHEQSSEVQIISRTPGFCQMFSARLCDFSIFRHPGYVLCLVGTFGTNQGLTSVIAHTPSRAVQLGVSRSKAALLLTAIGAAGLPARLVSSLLANLPRVNRILMHGIGVTLAGVTFMLTTLAVTYPSMVAACVVNGVFTGMFLTVHSTMLVDMLGVGQAAKAQAYYDMVVSLSALTATPFTGYLYDVTKAYDVPLYVAGGLQAAGGLLICCVPLLKKLSPPLPS